MAYLIGILVLACLGVWYLLGVWSFVLLGFYLAWWLVAHSGSLLSTRFVDWINPVKWGSVMYAQAMELVFGRHIVEQMVLRMYDSECRECMARGSCVHCGCDMSKVWVPWERCSADNWGEMILDADEYRRVRLEAPVMIEVRYLLEENQSLDNGNHTEVSKGQE